MANTVSKMFDEHEVWNELQRLEDALELAGERLGDIPEDIRSLHTSLVAFSNYVRLTLKASVPSLVPTTKLDVITNAISQVRSDIEQFNSGRHPHHGMAQAWNRVDGIYQALSGLPAIKTPPSARGIKSVLDSHERAMTTQSEALRSASAEMLNKLEEIEGKANELDSTLALQIELTQAALDDLRTKGIEEQRRQITEHTEALNEFRTRLTEIANEAADQRSGATIAADKQLQEFKASFDTFLEDWTTSVEDNRAEVVEKTGTLIGQIEDELAHAQHLVRMVGEVAMTGHYQKNAIEQQHAADKLRNYAALVGALAAISAVAIGISEIYLARDYDWMSILGRWTITFALVALAGYLANQSAGHRRREEQYRALELELATLEPFLNSLEEDERKKVIADLSQRYFQGLDRWPVDSAPSVKRRLRTKEEP